MTTTECPPLAERITKSLLGYGVLAGPCYVVVAAAQIAFRDGYDPTRHAVSQLVNGHLGWIQVANFVVTGLMTMAAGVGVGRALPRGGRARAAAILLVGYGAGVFLAGVLWADPSDGFPPGTPPGMGTPSWHGIAHLVVAATGFACFAAAALVVGGSFARMGAPGWAWCSRVTALAFAASFVALASGRGGAATVLLFTAAVVLAWAWLAAVSVTLYRSVGAT